MKNAIRKSIIFFALCIVALTSYNKSSGNNSRGITSSTTTGSGSIGVHFKIAGKQYDITSIKGIYDPASKIFAVFNAGLANFPTTTITLSIGRDFTRSTGTFKSDSDDKGFIFGFILYAGSLTKPVVGYGAGQDDSNSGETVANSPVTITLTSFSYSGSPGVTTGNVAAQGTFSGTVYDIINKTCVALTDGRINIHP